MILHLVLFKFHESFKWSDIEIIDAETTTRQHPSHISEILGWACGRNISSRIQAADFMVMGLFENQETLSAFIIHPNHHQGVLKWQKLSSWQVIDIDIGNDTTKFFGLFNKWTDFSLPELEELQVS
ncbi:Dabb family protein [Iodobacter fluviatilis]|jgi:hypothetical protein|uniref:Stress responsive protein n=1 Tax=Iodobacter fluviatilis TaxID=537 RepID=A0A7G3GDA6_9NEIS|nr:Dabb family protein [Iodobacter fluviatilis]QBC45099.1 stress responsive protein [Iodobacter fluviatilis]